MVKPPRRAVPFAASTDDNIPETKTSVAPGTYLALDTEIASA
jgi:hypothetical protein